MVCEQGCCADLRPQNSARQFSAPAPVMKKDFVLNIFKDSKLTVLEIGSGNLRNAAFLAAEGHLVDVVEIAPTMTRFQKIYEEFSRHGSVVAWENEKDVRLPRRAYDVVILTYVLETICDPKLRLKVLSFACRKMRKGGHAIISVRGRKDVIAAHASGVRCSDGYSTSSKTFIRGFNIAEIKLLLKNAGFAHVKPLHKKRTRAPELVHLVARRQASNDQ